MMVKFFSTSLPTGGISSLIVVGPILLAVIIASITASLLLLAPGIAHLGRFKIC